MPPETEPGIHALRRGVARWQTWWVRLFILSVLALSVAPLPRLWAVICMVVPLLLFLVRPPARRPEPAELRAPVRGRWIAFNSPGSRVPSHGVRAHGQMYAVDLIRGDADAPQGPGRTLLGRSPEDYPSFGAPVLAMAAGTVVHVTDHLRDHRARDSWPGLIWMMTLEGFLRLLGGAPAILGNRVVIRHDDWTFSACAHLRRSSAAVRAGDRVDAGQVVGQVGNTGNSSEPHLHVQLMDRSRTESAAGLPMRWSGVAVDPDRLSLRWATGYAKPSAVSGFPANGQYVDAPHPR